MKQIVTVKKNLSKQFYLFACLLILICGATNAQQLDDNSVQTVKLDNDVTVTLFRAMNPELSSLDANGDVKQVAPSNDYYYLPTNLRLGLRPDGVPEFLFTKFTTESKTGVNGAIMHMLMQWGLTAGQQAELDKKLKEVTKNPNAIVRGQVQLKADDERGGSFQIISATLSDKSFATAILNGRAPMLDGGKVAMATRLTADGAQLLASTFDKATSIADLSISLNYVYTTNFPAFKGKITYYWSRIAAYTDSIANHSKEDQSHAGTGWLGTLFGVGVSVDNATVDKSKFEKITQDMVEKKCIEVDIRESGLPDDRIAPLRAAFMELIVKSFTTPAEQQPVQLGKKSPEKDGNGNIIKDLSDGLKDVVSMTNVYGENHKEVTIKESFFQNINQKSTQVINVNYSLPIVKEASVTGNLASWYNGVKDNKSCVNSVNLNDPFFQHRDINFIMDLEAKEMFEKEINYVTVNVRKKRSQGNSFEDRVTMDMKYFNEKGITATMSYARGEDTDPDSYEYQSQWSLKGGNIYPPNPGWEKGKWEGVTLLPPLMPKTIEFEADLDNMKTANFARVTLQVRFSKFGQEVEENIPVSVSKNEPLVSKQIFMDRNTKGYAYRLIYNHKEAGKVATEWTSKINDYYVYATIQDGLKDKNSDVFKKGVEAAKTIAQADKNGVVTVNKVLDTFKDIFGDVSKKVLDKK